MRDKPELTMNVYTPVNAKTFDMKIAPIMRIMKKKRARSMVDVEPSRRAEAARLSSHRVHMKRKKRKTKMALVKDQMLGLQI